MIAAAARQLGLSTPRVYGLLRIFRNRQVTTALLPARSGPAKGARQLSPAVEARIEAAIDGREKIDLARFEDSEIWRGVATPSRTARGYHRSTMTRLSA